MSELRPCVGCRRHIDANERVCPFCGVFGRVSRAAAFAGAALVVTACGGTKPKAETVDNQTQVTADAGVDTPAPDPQAEPEPHPDDKDRHRRRHGGPKMPYGAPAASRRLV